MNVTAPLHRATQQRPGEPLTIFGDRVRTVAESSARVAALAGGLRGLGVAPGDRVGILALNSDRYHEFLLAVPWLGAAVNPVNIRWAPAEIAFSLTDCDTSVLFVDDTFTAHAGSLRPMVPGLRTLVHCGEAPTPPGMIAYEELAGADPIEDASAGGGDLYGVFYTGGTTGQPKGVKLSHDNLLVSALGSLATTDVIGRGGVLLHAAPLFHLAGVAAWLCGMLTGSTHLILPAFAPGPVAAAIARHQVTDAALVPTMIQTVADDPVTTTADLSSVRHVMYGASPIAQAVLDRARARMPNARFTQAYGMTELGPVATLLAAEEHEDGVHTGSAGRAASHAEVAIAGPDGTRLPAREVGEVVVRGDNVMLGYWNRPDDTTDAVRGGWMHTGDAGYLDERGYLFIVDRIKDMIVTGGENVYSAEVEKALAAHPAVATCAVVGVPDARWGERVHAVVVAAAGRAVDENELAGFCRARIAAYKVPRSFSFVTDLPLSAAGKVLKRKLREPYWQGAKRQVH